MEDQDFIYKKVNKAANFTHVCSWSDYLEFLKRLNPGRSKVIKIRSTEVNGNLINSFIKFDLDGLYKITKK